MRLSPITKASTRWNSTDKIQQEKSQKKDETCIILHQGNNTKLKKIIKKIQNFKPIKQGY